MAWRFGEYVLDPLRAELRGAEGPIHVERHTLDVYAERVVTRDDLIDAVWGGRIVSDATISTAIKHARKAIGDSGAEQTYIKTVHRRGFAAAASELSGATHSAHRYRNRVLLDKPGANADLFFQAFPFQFAHHRKTLTDSFERLGLN